MQTANMQLSIKYYARIQAQLDMLYTQPSKVRTTKVELYNPPNNYYSQSTLAYALHFARFVLHVALSSLSDLQFRLADNHSIDIRYTCKKPQLSECIDPKFIRAN